MDNLQHYSQYIQLSYLLTLEYYILHCLVMEIIQKDMLPNMVIMHMETQLLVTTILLKGKCTKQKL